MADITNHISESPGDMIREIASKMSPGDIIALCKTSRQFNAEICSNERFWMYMVRRHFPAEEKNIGMIRETRSGGEMIPSGAEPLPLYYAKPSRKSYANMRDEMNKTHYIIEGKVVKPTDIARYWDPNHPNDPRTMGLILPEHVKKFKFSDWKAYFIYLYEMEKELKTARQNELAEKILSNPVFKAKKNSEKEAIYAEMIRRGMDAGTLRALVQKRRI